MQGLEELRDTIAKYTSAKKDYNYKSENVIIGPGSKELMFLLHILFDGEIILPCTKLGFLCSTSNSWKNKIQYHTNNKRKQLVSHRRRN